KPLPIEIISEILQVAYGEDAFVSTDRDNHVCIGLLDRSPSAADHTVQDAVIVRISEQPEWPDFGNRIKISASGSLAGYGVQLSIAQKCLSADGESRSKLFARVTDQDGDPVNDLPIAWSTKFNLVSFDQAVSNTAQISIFDEEQRSKSFNEIDLEFPPETVLGVYAYRDTRKTENLSAGGYTISGNTIRLTETLAYCDQLVRVDYTVSGVAVNYATAGSSSGTETITAGLSGNQDSQEIYLDNPCACPPSLRLIANPSSIQVNESARLLAYAESGGLPVADGRTIYMTVDSNPAHGHLPATELRAQQVEVTNENTSAINEVSGISQCELDMYAVSVQGVYRAQQDLAGNWSKTGASLYSSHVGKLVTLNTRLTTGVNLIVDYTTRGAVVNHFIGIQAGTDRIRALMATSREEPLESSVSITVRAKLESGGVEGCCDSGLDLDEDDPGYGTSGGSGKNKWDHTPSVGCGDLDCRQGETCCTNPDGEDFECRPLSECDGGALRECYPIDCQQNPTSDCMESRFGQALQDGGEECNCTKLCEEEFNHFGTTQNYDGSSYEGINTKVLNEGYAAGSPAFWERYEELKAAAMGACRKQCGDCETADPLAISGPDAVTTPGGYSYAVSGGLASYEWSISGTGASIDQNGNVTLAGEACGSYTVTCTDACGNSASISARVTNNGHWEYQGIISCNFTYGGGGGYCGDGWGGCTLEENAEEISGDTKKKYGVVVGRWCCEGPNCTTPWFQSDCPTQSSHALAGYCVPYNLCGGGGMGLHFCSYSYYRLYKWVC
ncbi:MAG: hypothetical protein WC271_15730, partial [Bacteroidales bacterium]